MQIQKPVLRVKQKHLNWTEKNTLENRLTLGRARENSHGHSHWGSLCYTKNILVATRNTKLFGICIWYVHSTIQGTAVPGGVVMSKSTRLREREMVAMYHSFTQKVSDATWQLSPSICCCAFCFGYVFVFVIVGKLLVHTEFPDRLYLHQIVMKTTIAESLPTSPTLPPDHLLEVLACCDY